MRALAGAQRGVLQAVHATPGVASPPNPHPPHQQQVDHTHQPRAACLQCMATTSIQTEAKKVVGTVGNVVASCAETDLGEQRLGGWQLGAVAGELG